MNQAVNFSSIENNLIFEDHPNPSWARQKWISLDGEWTIEHQRQKHCIQVPYPIGSELSGVHFKDKGTFKYSKSIEIMKLFEKKRFILNVGACDYSTTVFVNHARIGRHIGGYSSFTFDITEALHQGTNKIELIVRDSHSPFQVRGKQTFLRKPFYVWYNGISGLWQNVWMEIVDRTYLMQGELNSDFDTNILRGRIPTSLTANNSSESPEIADYCLHIEIVTPHGETINLNPVKMNNKGEFHFQCSFSEIKATLWSPDNPALYRIRYDLYREQQCIDTVESYFGLRSVHIDSDGSFLINGKKCFIKMALAQGYYPKGVYTPENKKIIQNDILNLKLMGYNGARIHEKIESPYFQYLCDKIGIFTSFEMPSFYLPSRKGFRAYEKELIDLIKRDSGHPSCILRILFNETWGIWGIYWKKSRTDKFVRKMITMTRKLDPSRPIIDNSGWEHIDTDIVDFHHYLGSASLARTTYQKIAKNDRKVLFGFSKLRVLAFYLFNWVSTRTRSIYLRAPLAPRGIDCGKRKKIFLSEYGGFGWYTNRDSNSVIDLIEEYTQDILASDIFSGYCYTQLYDVYNETNGLLSFNREPKIDPARLRSINAIDGSEGISFTD
ncbi:MAG TPA: glycoside hydrolase family 2 TIM barrel-domain containing protein [Rectinema sp.]|nr:glycoside hydrolase family 2 TIM barrel-domain containing protein [Rectinema sp.]